jgi:hypothetical protein
VKARTKHLFLVFITLCTGLRKWHKLLEGVETAANPTQMQCLGIQTVQQVMLPHA